MKHKLAGMIGLVAGASLSLCTASYAATYTFTGNDTAGDPVDASATVALGAITGGDAVLNIAI